MHVEKNFSCYNINDDTVVTWYSQLLWFLLLTKYQSLQYPHTKVNAANAELKGVHCGMEISNQPVEKVKDRS